ncbi:YwqG family protein [Pararhizobium sp. BT-229]|uniref:YwqG family protein n=1 Tax=Pararhizobium sp. BT-229 TaxID=2986923 RepID=UPI0021F7A685|nr:YwqG family protein [Pararhizobium sp. BT-229]MCV9964717.1 YwqG family protein [Pararhizobium sp. BT-229]
MPFMMPADENRQIELMPELMRAVVFEKDNPNYPLHVDRTVRHVLSRWENWGSFAVLDELCGADGLRDSFFPEIPSIAMLGEQFGSSDVLNLEVEWLGTDGAQVTITYHKDAHVRMVAERNESLRLAAEKRAAEYPPLADVISEYRKLGRQSWTPAVEPGDPSERMSSRYFGLPWMPHDAVWPVNEQGVPLAFVMQINIADLPSAMRSRLGNEGMVAMFYDVDVEWDPDYTQPEDYEIAAVFHRYDTALDGDIRKGRKLEGKLQRIASWRAATDYPDLEDVTAGSEIGIEVQKFMIDTGFEPGDTGYRRRGMPPAEDDVPNYIRRAEDLWGADACDAEAAADCIDMFCAAGDKLGGWPAWDGGRRWPENEGRKMALFYQIDVMDPIWEGFAFWRGDERAHIFFDEKDTHVFRLAWDRGNGY